MSLVVTCPSCGTVFTMVREQLEASDGRVRCGHCMEVFDAQMQLTHMNDLDREHSQVPQSDALPHHLSFVQQAEKEQFWSRPLMRLLLILVALLFFVLLGVQLVRAEREQVARIVPATAPVIETLCKIWPCQPVARRQIESWQIESSSFQKEGASAFRLTATLENTSKSTLLTPQVELQLLDSSDALLVRHAIASNASDPQMLAGGAEHTFHWIVSPQISANASVKLQIKDMAGYRLTLFYP